MLWLNMRAFQINLQISSAFFGNVWSMANVDLRRDDVEDVLEAKLVRDLDVLYLRKQQLYKLHSVP